MRFIGRADWVCPACGRVNDSRFVIGQAYITCHNDRCDRRFGVGFTFYVLRMDGPRVRTAPHDYIIPRDAMDVATMAIEPEDGAPWHRVVDASDINSDVIP